MIMFMRIDRLLCEMNIGTRSQVKELIKKGQVCANGMVIKKPETQIDETSAVITCQGKEYRYSPYVYYMMNKPSGVITATRDEKEQTVLDVLGAELMKRNHGDLTGIPINDISPVGRLDKDTVGLLILTNDGNLAHNLLSPKKHVPKKYLVRTDMPVSDEMVKCLEEGVVIGPEEKTLPAILENRSGNQCCITITEGKYHQVKRMFHAVGVQVIYLKRLSMGTLILDERLCEGQVRELTQEEVNALCLRI